MGGNAGIYQNIQKMTGQKVARSTRAYELATCNGWTTGGGRGGAGVRGVAGRGSVERERVLGGEDHGEKKGE